MTDPRAYEKHAWLILFGLGILTVISAPIGLLGIPPNPPSPEATTGTTLAQLEAQIPGLHNFIGGISVQLGNFMLATGALLTGIAAFPYRRGEKWAWAACWIIVVLLIIQLVNNLATGGFLWQLDLAVLVLVLAGLLLPYRTFFRRPDSGTC
jgi:hypothetical protein